MVLRGITEKILDMSLDECTALAQERMDTEVIFEIPLEGAAKFVRVETSKLP